MSKKRSIGEPAMSDKSILVNVEDLIGITFGVTAGNTVNFKMLETVLHILARQMRLLEQDVEIKLAVEEEKRLPALKERDEDVESSSSVSDVEEKIKSKGKEAKEAAKKAMDKEKAERKEKEKADKKEKAEQKEKGKAEKAELKEKERAEKKEKAEQKEKDKAVKAEQKENDKAEKAGQKEKDKAEKAGQKEKEKAEKAEQKEKEKAEKAGQKEKEKAEKTERKEREKAEKSEQKEKERAERKEADQLSMRSAKRESKTSIAVSERKGRGDKDKVLVVEKGVPASAGSRSRVGSIEVVTRSDFDLLQATVNQLLGKSGPIPMPTMPTSKKLKTDILKGSASLPDTMQAMQVNARVQAAEQALTRMAGLLTQLAAAGVFPPELAGKLDQIQADLQNIAQDMGDESDTRMTTSRKSVAIDPVSRRSSAASRPSSTHAKGLASAIASRASILSSAPTTNAGVTQPEMQEMLQIMKEELMIDIANMTARATAAAEHANNMAKSVVEKLDIALKLDCRIENLYSVTTDYSEQLTGFDSGLTTQMQSFQEQMTQMRGDLRGGLMQLESANNNAETAAVMELRKSYETLVLELDQTVHAHSSLIIIQNQLGEELKGLIEWVENLREQKCDRDEVMDGLRDKADLNRLQGLLHMDAFESTQQELYKRLDLCYDKFQKQDKVWLGAIKDLTGIADGKAEIMHLLALKDFATDNLREMQHTLYDLSIMLGEPKAALLTRKLALNAQCGACMLPALMSPWDKDYGAPPLLPAMTQRGKVPEEEPCKKELQIPAPVDARDHICKRWVGGSHTLISEHVKREHADPLRSDGVPTKKYTGFGNDGRLYMMEVPLEPCIECNQLDKGVGDPPPSEVGAGDQKSNI